MRIKTKQPRLGLSEINTKSLIKQSINMRKVIMTIATAIALAFAPLAMAGANNTTATEQVATSKTTVNLANSKQASVKWTARNGQTYTVYVSRNGKAFVVRTSAKTGNEYRYYNLPEDIKQQAINSVNNK